MLGSNRASKSGQGALLVPPVDLTVPENLETATFANG